MLFAQRNPIKKGRLIQSAPFLCDTPIRPFRPKTLYNGMLPCFFLGKWATLFSSIANALMSLVRV